MFPTRIAPRASEIHVVRIAIDRSGEDGAALLDDPERERAGRFLFDRDRRRFTAAHAALRVVLGRLLGCNPASLAFAAGPQGKPVLASPHARLGFNLSHAGERALIAVALDRAVGVDIEAERDVDHIALARRFFSASESRALGTLAPGDQRAAFFRAWTRKEAFIKAIGDGLTFPLADFDVSLTDELLAQALLDARPQQLLERWRIVPLPAEPGYAAALAGEAGDWRLTCWNEIESA